MLVKKALKAKKGTFFQKCLCLMVLKISLTTSPDTLEQALLGVL